MTRGKKPGRLVKISRHFIGSKKQFSQWQIHLPTDIGRKLDEVGATHLYVEFDEMSLMLRLTPLDIASVVDVGRSLVPQSKATGYEALAERITRD